MTNYENDIQVITKNGAEGELTQASINNGEIESVNTTTLQSEANELNPLAEPVATGQKNIILVDEASSVSSGNNIYINQDNKLMQIDYDTLATAILNKLSTQSFDSLNTSSKLVLGAINELNGKRINDFIPSGIYDLNNPPDYFMFKARTGSTHIPEGMGNQFLVFRVVLDNDIYDAMLAIGFDGNRIALNTKNGSSTWGGWKYATFQ